MATSPVRALTTLPLVLAPALLGAALLTDISPQASDTRELLTLIAERPAAWTTSQTLFLLSAMAWVPAGLALMRFFGQRVRVGRFAAVCVAVGGLAMLPLDAAGPHLRELATSTIPLDQQTSLVEGAESSSTLIAFEILHVAGLFVGLLAVGVAMLLHRQPSRWIGVLVLVGTVGLVIAPGGPLVGIAAAPLVIGLGVVAVSMGRVPGSLDGGPDGTRFGLATSTGTGLHDSAL